MSHTVETGRAASPAQENSLSRLAGELAPREMLVDVARLEKEYCERHPDLQDANQPGSFGTSGQRRSPFQGTFTVAHILAITQAICDYRRSSRTDGPLYLGKDTQALSGPAQRTALEVLGANSGKGPGEHYHELTAEFGNSYYKRIDAPASPDEKQNLGKLSPETVKETELAGEPITAKLTGAPGNHAPIGGLKVVTRSGWLAARPSGTENIYKIYAESFESEQHLNAIVTEAQKIVSNALPLSAVGSA